VSETDELWYKDAVIYEVHVRAFHDSVDDGMGDFRGLTSKLDYLQDLGVTAIWILPFYPSPWKDDGYDIADYTGIHPRYGRLADFREFLEAAHHRGIRVITELVLNHTSDRHPWFQQARLAPPGSPERDFYVWSDTPNRYRDARIIFQDFEPSNWTWDPVAKAYFWHRFYSNQPDLNFDNPAVWEAIMPVVDFWFEMGVDGMRLDAIPYLYEREGTNCENLPETHAFLKALRAHVDAKFPNRMFLAEANQWPEDAVAYFGDGDECHMSFHFPLMPRLFMGLHQEDRFPIIDILDQTPAIPESCQWCLFLRNHDELTLEMVTDEERDSMYRAYAQDPEARINLGIRRRLAPLLRNDRRRIELMNALLFSLPGTPVIYYGDEIGMGDNFYLGDRNGVRTPMQWSADRNAGFSRANPQKLYLPIIIDPEYHYEAINVEAQQNNPSSLLWWMKRLVALRKRYRAFGRGSMTFLKPENPKVLAFLRRMDDECILVVANLSRFVQHAELDLREFAGLVPEELFGRSLFPVISEAAYPLSLGPHGFYWFSLSPQESALSASPAPASVLDSIADLPLLKIRNRWTEILSSAQRGQVEALLPTFLQRRRPGRVSTAPIASAQILERASQTTGEREVEFTIVRLEFRSGLPETYFLPLMFVPEDQAERLLEPLSTAGLARIQGPNYSGLICDALAVPDYAEAVLQAIVAGQVVVTDQDEEIAAVPLPGLADLATPRPGEGPPGLRRSDRNNLSITFGDRLVLKTFRRMEPGINPDLEIGRFLTERQPFAATAPVAGFIEFRRRGAPVTLAVLHQYVPSQGTAWQFTLDQLSSFFERAAALTKDRAPVPSASSAFAMAGGSDETASPLDWWRELSGAYLATASVLGRRTAELHHALSADHNDPAFAPEPFSRLYQRSLYQSIRTRIGQLCVRLNRERSKLPEAAKPFANQLIERQETVVRFARVLFDKPIAAYRIRCHGDYHLGQLLHTGNDFVIIDFEGDTSQTINERRVKRSPLRDVAGMIRSFDLAAQSVLFGLTDGPQSGRPLGHIRPEDRNLLEPWADAWSHQVARAFLDTYLKHLEPAGILPSDPDVVRPMMTYFLLEKMLHEIDAELTYRPDWTVFSLRAALRLLDEEIEPMA
jgi:maltose alpha-D-glucosyltransferase/alpha-amylase